MKIKILAIASIVVLFGMVAGFVIFNLSGLSEIDSSSSGVVGGSRFAGVDNLLFKLCLYLIGGIVLGALVIIFVLPRFAGAVADMIFYQNPGKLAESALDRARSLMQQGEYEEAVEELDFLISSGSPEALVFFEKSRVQHEKLEDSDSAITTLRQGIDFKEWEMDDDVTFRLILGNLLLAAKGDRDGAIKMYKEVLEKYPDSEFHTGLAKTELLEMGVVV